ncbi:MAG TPA: TonB-dependent receptor [Sphingomicrobium sp.]
MTDRKRPFLITTSVAGALSLVLSTPAAAQTQSEPQAQVSPQTPAIGQPTPQPDQSTSNGGAPSDEDIDSEEGGEIVVTGVRRGSVIGDIPPENILNGRDVRATGANDISELLDALAPQIGSARGRGGEQPVLLLDGRRVSGFRELRDIPTEAISRVEILPEEVALKYGYRADQRVVNIVLRERFLSTIARVGASTTTEGGWVSGNGDVTQLHLNRAGRTTTSVHVEGNSALTENERDIRLDDPSQPDDRSARTLQGSRRLVRGTETLNRTVLGDVNATVNAEAQYSEGRSLFGLSQFALNPLERDSNSLTGHLGFSLNGDKDKWHWSATGNGDVARNVTRSDRRDEAGRDRSETTTVSADVDLMANGPLFALPAGDATATFSVGGSTVHQDGDARNAGVLRPTDLSRTLGSVSANFDLPISRRNRDFSALGNLTLNANAEVDQLSDFGTLTTIGAGLNWSPVDRVELITSWTREEGAPSIQQLGDPFLSTPGTRIFDFTTGQTVEVTSITGGNSELRSDKRNVVKIGANWKPWEDTDFRLRTDYVHSRIDRPISTFPGVTAELQAAFPDRFIRSGGQLVSVDFRPVNFDHSERDTLRWGFDFSKPLKSKPPSQAAIERFRAMRQAQGGNQGSNSQQPQGTAPPPEAGPPPGGPPPSGPGGGGFGPSGGRGFGGGGFGGFGGFGRGGRQGGRLTFSLTHTINLVDRVTIAPGVPELNYLHGSALGSTGGRPRHEVEAQAGYFNNGLGARVSADWRSGTRVDTDNGDLRFSSLATFDLRLFANLGEDLDLVSKHPWLRGSSVRLELTNIFDAKPNVRDAFGIVPNNYQPDLLDPLGRTISISFRKLFLPSRETMRREFQQDRQRQAQ